METRPFEAPDAFSIELQYVQKLAADYLSDVALEEMERHPSFTMLMDSQPVAIVGVIPWNLHRGYVWAYLSETNRREFIKIHNMTKGLIDRCNLPRLETYVDCEFEEGHRWMNALGFRVEAERMKNFTEEGRDMALYAKIKEH